MTSREKLERFLEEYEQVNIVISDLHLGARYPRTINGEVVDEYHFIRRLLDYFEGIEHLCFLGDTIDLSEGDIKTSVKAGKFLFKELKGRGKLFHSYFVRGNHDQEYDLLAWKLPVLVQSYVRFIIPECEILMLHGNGLGLEAGRGTTQSYIEAKRKLIQSQKHALKERDWLIFGHAHVPGISIEDRVCGLSSWSGELSSGENRTLKRRFGLITIRRKELPRLGAQKEQEQLVRIRDVPFEWFSD